MLVQIIRNEAKPEESLLMFGVTKELKVSELPEGLKTKFLSVLPKLEGVKKVSEERESEPLFDIEDKVGSCFPGGTIEDLKTAMNLVRWYMRPHWYTKKVKRWKVSCCIHCDAWRTTAKEFKKNPYCKDPNCSSHAMWKQIVGETYQTPAPVKRAFRFPGVSLG
ncbi:MAG: hypothetical protein Q8Q24_02515 [bacterium]|nr:hypothetical protein [bacterium]